MEIKATDLPDPGMLPDHPLYFLKSWSEGIGNLFTFGEENKAERFLNLSEKRIAEANALFEKGNLEVAEKTLQKYEEQLEKSLERSQRAKEKGINIDQLSERVSEATLKHQDVLLDNYEKVPEEARQGIERAMEGSRRGHERALEAVSEERREEAKERVKQQKGEVEERMEGLRKRGIPVPEEERGRPEETGERPEDLPEETEERLDEVLGEDRRQEGRGR